MELRFSIGHSCFIGLGSLFTEKVIVHTDIVGSLVFRKQVINCLPDNLIFRPPGKCLKRFVAALVKPVCVLVVNRVRNGMLPLAHAIIGGLITSTMLTLVVVPVIYTILDDLKNKIFSREKRAGVKLEGE